MSFLKLKTIFPLLALAVFLLPSCKEAKKTAEENTETSTLNNTKALTIHRYEKALFSIPQNNFEDGLKKIAPEYNVFLGDNYTSPEAIGQLREFVANSQNQQVYTECLKQFPDLSGITDDFKKAFNILQENMPGYQIPQVYTYVSGFDFQYPIKYADSALIIALDMYLGNDYIGYREIGIPVYIAGRLTADHILPDCMKAMSLPLIQSSKSQVLLDAMIEEGKSLYFTDVTLPETDDQFKIGYTEEQLKWCANNEKNLWSFLIENELLYSSDAKSISIFMTDGPFTASFSQESPSRTGAWLGWQIVKSYMKNNNIGLAGLMANANSQEILEKSGYKPKK